MLDDSRLFLFKLSALKKNSADQTSKAENNIERMAYLKT